ncbi:unnamed protein product (mitochondrion) [Plasmodiophora brassicae]|uniref:Uncharacterized protein n=1 Tax=Plasmodiophora brassicae TaxID=37360 RepID=A0A3P3Y023_PLABS|nr:unnamed protein product [Plasmodiophora brassicae]
MPSKVCIAFAVLLAIVSTGQAWSPYWGGAAATVPFYGGYGAPFAPTGAGVYPYGGMAAYPSNAYMSGYASPFGYGYQSSFGTGFDAQSSTSFSSNYFGGGGLALSNNFAGGGLALSNNFAGGGFYGAPYGYMY